ncbi:UNVERIFIED_CONTAM: hypothetical protein OHV15_16535 [Microbacterium sp. SLM126]
MKKLLDVVGAIAVGAAAGTALCLGISIAASAAAPSDRVPEGVKYDFAALYADPKTGDNLPATVRAADLGSHGLRPESIRLISSSSKVQFFAALDTMGQLCLVAYIPGRNWTAGTTCAKPEEFAQAGMGIRVYAQGAGAIEGYLLPDAASSESSTGLDRARALSIAKTSLPNLVVIDPAMSVSERRSFLAAYGDFPLTLIDAPIEP